MARTPNGYRQVRLTYTEEASGRLSYRVMVKPANAQWSERHTVISDSLVVAEPCTSLEDVFRRLALICSEQFLPGSLD